MQNVYIPSTEQTEPVMMNMKLFRPFSVDMSLADLGIAAYLTKHAQI